MNIMRGLAKMWSRFSDILLSCSKSWSRFGIIRVCLWIICQRLHPLCLFLLSPYLPPGVSGKSSTTTVNLQRFSVFSLLLLFRALNLPEHYQRGRNYALRLLCLLTCRYIEEGSFDIYTDKASVVISGNMTLRCRGLTLFNSTKFCTMV